MTNPFSIFRRNAPRDQVPTIVLERIEWARSFINNGYEPIPIFGRDKMPYIFGWQNPPGDRVTIETFEEWIMEHQDHLSIGFLTRFLPSIDIDLKNDQHASDVADAVVALIGDTPLVRRGSKGFMLSYRLAEGETIPFHKRVIKKRRIADEPLSVFVELLGDRAQFVGYGIHPTTNKPYRWLKHDGKTIFEPYSVPVGELPEITVAQFESVVTVVIDKLKELGYDAECRGDAGQIGAGPCQLEHKKKEASLVPEEKRYPIDVAELFVNLWHNNGPTKKSSSGYENTQSCPSCGHHDWKLGLRLHEGGSLDIHCFHSACEYSTATIWEPGWFPGARLKKIYELLGGDTSDFIYDPWARFKPDIEEMQEWFNNSRNKRKQQAS